MKYNKTNVEKSLAFMIKVSEERRRKEEGYFQRGWEELAGNIDDKNRMVLMEVMQSHS